MAHRHRVPGNARWISVIAAAVCVRPQVAVPTITLTSGDFYFSLDGTPSFLLGTNPTGWMTPQFDTLLGQTRTVTHVSGMDLASLARPEGLEPSTPGLEGPMSER